MKNRDSHRACVKENYKRKRCVLLIHGTHHLLQEGRTHAWGLHSYEPVTNRVPNPATSAESRTKEYPMAWLDSWLVSHLPQQHISECRPNTVTTNVSILQSYENSPFSRCATPTFVVFTWLSVPSVVLLSIPLCSLCAKNSARKKKCVIWALLLIGRVLLPFNSVELNSVATSVVAGVHTKF